MSDTVVSVENLSKAYLLGHQAKHDTFFGSLAAVVKSPLHNLRQLRRLNTFNLSKAGEEDEDILWALRDVSFEVKRGEVLGIIGRNGAGKSTLLKILSQIAYPTHGRVEIRGRVSALLEVGTGFHPELTGRENVYLNGTILGMQKAEIDSKFDEIVDFSGVEKFLDTPVKRYSSGMKVRLAFSVAAHLEPEILIIDEVLAVGDAEFQKKCLGKMQEVATGEGRTVLFVSHNMGAVQRLCPRAILLSAGTLELNDFSSSAVEQYLRRDASHERMTGRWDRGRDGDSTAITSVVLRDDNRGCNGTLLSGSAISVEISYEHSEDLANPIFGIFVETAQGARLFFLQSELQHGDIKSLPSSGQITCRLGRLPLPAGDYYLTIVCRAASRRVDRLSQAVSFEVIEADFFGTGHLPKARQGLTLVDAEWEFGCE